MKWWGLLVSVLFLASLMGFILWMVYSFASNVFMAVRQSVPLSPLEDNVKIDDTRECSDSDGGIFLNKKGTVTYKTGILFLKWYVDISDECNGNELTEYYCGGENYFTKGVVTCEKECAEGRCIG